MEQAMFPHNGNNTPLENEDLVDAEGHRTDEELEARQ